MSETTKIEVMEIEFGGEMGLVAWGVHDPADFVAACAGYGLEPEDAAYVDHVRFVELKEHNGFEFWLEPAQGEPNATEYRP